MKNVLALVVFSLLLTNFIYFHAYLCIFIYISDETYALLNGTFLSLSLKFVLVSFLFFGFKFMREREREKQKERTERDRENRERDRE